MLELLGATCLVIAAATLHPSLAWLVAGVSLIAKAFELETRGAPPSDRPPKPPRTPKQH